MGFEDILSRDKLREITERSTPPTQEELALIMAQGVIDGMREGERARFERATKTTQPDRKNQ